MRITELSLQLKPKSLDIPAQKFVQQMYDEYPRNLLNSIKNFL